MNRITIIALCLFLLTSCKTAYHYQSENNPEQYEGKNIALVTQQWGTADQIFHTQSGISYYLYTATAGRNFFSATSTNFDLVESGADFPMRGQAGLKCSAIFKTDQNGVIIATSHSGSNCGGEWAPNQ